MTNRGELLERLDKLVDDARALRPDVADLSDHTYEIDALRERVRELEADKLDLIDIVNKFRAAFSFWDVGNDLEAADILTSARDAMDGYAKEHGGML